MGLRQLHYRISFPVTWYGQRPVRGDNVRNLEINEKKPKDPVCTHQRMTARSDPQADLSDLDRL